MVDFLTYDQMFSGVENNLKTQAQPLTDFNQGAGLRMLVQAFVATLSLRETRLTELQKSFYIKTATGTDLDNRLADFDFYRIGGSYSTGAITISGTGISGSITIPANSLLIDPNTQYRYRTSDLVSLSNNISKTVNVTAEAEGFLSNQSVGTSLSFVSYPTITATVSTAITAGNITETDAGFVQRFISYITSLSKSTKDAILSSVLGVSGVVSAYVDNITSVPGAFNVYIDDGNGTASQSLLDSVATAVGTVSAAGTYYTVKAITQVPIVVTLTVKTTNTLDTNLLSNITTNLTTLSNSLVIGQTLYLSQIQQAVMNTTSTSSVILNATISSPLTDTIIDNTKIIRFSSIGVSYAS